MRNLNVLLKALRSRRSLWSLIHLQDLSASETLSALEELISKGIVEIVDGKFVLTEKGKESTSKMSHVEVQCKKCRGTGINLENIKDRVEKFKELTAGRPEPIMDYDQGYIKPEDVVRRAAYIYHMGDLENRDILIIGDDDLLSIAIGVFGGYKSITVTDIDARLLDYIESVAEKAGIENLKTFRYDVRKELPDDMKGSFDTFITDPVETHNGILLFVSRGLQGLRKYGVTYFGLTHIEASLEKWYGIEKELLNMGFVTTDILRDFSIYPSKGNIGNFVEKYKLYQQAREKLPDADLKIESDFYRSSFIRMVAVDSKPLFIGPQELTEKIYMDDEAFVTPQKISGGR